MRQIGRGSSEELLVNKKNFSVLYQKSKQRNIVTFVVSFAPQNVCQTTEAPWESYINDFNPEGEERGQKKWCLFFKAYLWDGIGKKVKNLKIWLMSFMDDPLEKQHSPPHAYYTLHMIASWNFYKSVLTIYMALMIFFLAFFYYETKITRYVI